MLSNFEEQDAWFGNSWTVPAWRWGFSRRHALLGRWQNAHPPAGSPCSANTSGFGISYGYIRSRLLWTQLWYPAEEEVAWLARWPPISQFIWYKAAPCLGALVPSVSPRPAQAHRWHAAAHGCMGSKCGYSPEQHKYSTESWRHWPWPSTLDRIFHLSQRQRTISATMDSARCFFPNVLADITCQGGKKKAPGILADLFPYPMWWTLSSLVFGKLKGPKEDGRWTGAFTGL